MLQELEAFLIKFSLQSSAQEFLQEIGVDLHRDVLMYMSWEKVLTIGSADHADATHRHWLPFLQSTLRHRKNKTLWSSTSGKSAYAKARVQETFLSCRHTSVGSSSSSTAAKNASMSTCIHVLVRSISAFILASFASMALFKQQPFYVLSYLSPLCQLRYCLVPIEQSTSMITSYALIFLYCLRPSPDPASCGSVPWSALACAPHF